MIKNPAMCIVTASQLKDQLGRSLGLIDDVVAEPAVLDSQVAIVGIKEFLTSLGVLAFRSGSRAPGSRPCSPSGQCPPAADGLHPTADQLVEPVTDRLFPGGSISVCSAFSTC
ncbi:hypothetical protein [Nesterenkonia muleiensis]|uniref:hypothetical protein n=1 Tax=Nesterenkonia muleiensis TaxID=2282648 RepID=UPI000E75CA57|nr:hypothetical protein [Nesterenkonia muleiensis]